MQSGVHGREAGDGQLDHDQPQSAVFWFTLAIFAALWLGYMLWGWMNAADKKPPEPTEPPNDDPDEEADRQWEAYKRWEKEHAQCD